MLINWTKYDKKEAQAIAKEFGTNVVAEMMFNLSQMSLIDKGNLLRSLKHRVSTQNGFAGEVDKISFTYEFYGKFLERGAKNVFGKNVTLQPTNWRSKAIDKHKEKLDDKFSEFYGKLILDELEIQPAKLEM
jgi:hypothetical protein